MLDGPPKDVEGQCNARLFLGDDWGDNQCTIRCKQGPDHEGPHRDEFMRDGTPVTITWVRDERHKCAIHGQQSDDHCPACDEHFAKTYDGEAG